MDAKAGVQHLGNGIRVLAAAVLGNILHDRVAESAAEYSNAPQHGTDQHPEPILR
jgi:hypothetical protein